MYEQDYILRLIEKFFSELNNFIHGKPSESNQEQENHLSNLYNAYLQAEPSFFYTSDVKTIFTYLSERCNEQDLPLQIEILSELLYQDGLLKEDKTLKASILEKALFFFTYLEEISETYSMEREEKISFIRKELGAKNMG